MVLNPFAHFGQPTIWPRGFQIDQISNTIYNDYILAEKPTSIIQQGVVNGDPDVDAIFRLTKSRKNKRFDIKFDDSSPSVKIPMFKFTPFNSQNTLFHYESFWALYLSLNKAAAKNQIAFKISSLYVLPGLSPARSIYLTHENSSGVKSHSHATSIA